MICLSEKRFGDEKIMTKLLIIFTCIVVLVVNWDSFSSKVNMDKAVDITTTIIEKVKE